jgi:hypothetical protein
MALETGTYISDLNSSNPVATDGLSQADDHIRLVKSTIKSTLPNLTGAVTSTQAELNILDGATVTTAELNTLDGLTASTADLNKMDGLTATKAELNRTDGVTSNIQTQLNGKVPTSRTITTGGGLDGGGNLTGNRTISHANTSNQGSVNNSGNTVIQDITVDTYGHVTNINSKTIPSNSLNTSNKAWTDGSGGLQIRYGSFSSSTDDNQTVSFNTPFSNQCFVCIVGGEVHTESVSRTSFVADRENSYSGTIVFQYIALGR